MHCINTNTREEVAVKTLRKSRIDRDEVMREISIISTIRHPHIVAFKALYENTEYIFIEMELLQGGTLKRHIDKYGALKESIAAKIM